MKTITKQEFEQKVQQLAIQTEAVLRLLTPEQRISAEGQNPKMAHRHNRIMFEMFSMARN